MKMFPENTIHCVLLVAFSLTVLLKGTFADGDGPVANTKYGQLRGTYLSIPDNEKKSLSFLGVPYVAPPLGDLRFKPPQPLEPWEGIKDVTEFGAPCPQIVDFILTMFKQVMQLEIEKRKDPSEDCVTLDIYTPSLTGKRPVMVFIHGGGLVTGWSSMTDFRAYAIVEDIVAVSIQYRLAALGWLSTGDDLIEGNMGFQDQVAALKWVQENIADFGGDPDQVTIFGESAGAWSVSMHILSPASSGLFHRAIVESGAVVDSLAFDPPLSARSTALNLGQSLGCPVENMEELVECLQKQPVEYLVNPSSSDNYNEIYASVAYVPKLDKNYFPELPADLLRKGNFNRNIDTIIGVCSTEGFMISMLSNPKFLQPDFNMEDFRLAVHGDMAQRYPNSPPDVINALVDDVLRAYSKASSGDQLRLDFSDWLGDTTLTLSTLNLAVGLSEKGKGKTYFYEFRHRPSLSKRPDYIGADHGDDIFFIYGLQYSGDTIGLKYGEEETKLADQMMKYWTNFGRTGDPNGENLVQWPEFKGANGTFIVLLPEPIVEHNFKASRMDIYRERAPAIVANAKAKASSIPGEGPIVEIKYGKVKGKIIKLVDGDKSGFAFLNIPFAAPPVGELRFKAPQPVQLWEGVRDATKLGLPCCQMTDIITGEVRTQYDIDLQPLTERTEDCLHLNIYTSNLKEKRPVMVFIHGGGLVAGWASTYDMRVYAILHNIVGVVIQYRLGALGYLNTGDGLVDTNVAFKDQVAALKWVQENIADFGGDPDRVTIFGESAGSYSVSMHLLSPASKGLFHRAILQSGSIYDAFQFSPPIPAAGEMIKLANLLGCPNTSSEVIVECLQSKPASFLMDPTGTNKINPLTMTNFVPSVEEGYFDDHPTNLFNSGKFNKDVQVMAGLCKVEGYGLSKLFSPNFGKPEFDVSEFQQVVGAILGGMKFPGNERVGEMVEAATALYVKDQKQGDGITVALSQFVGDLFISSGTFETISRVAEFSSQNTFMYEFAERPDLSKRPDYIITEHADDLFYTFGYSYIGEFDGVPLKYRELENTRKVEDTMMTYWANFARTGDPNGDGLLTWPQFKDKEFMTLSKEPSVGHDYESDRMNFWTKTLPTLAAPKEKGKEEL